MGMIDRFRRLVGDFIAGLMDEALTVIITNRDYCEFIWNQVQRQCDFRVIEMEMR